MYPACHRVHFYSKSLSNLLSVATLIPEAIIRSNAVLVSNHLPSLFPPSSVFPALNSRDPLNTETWSYLPLLINPWQFSQTIRTRASLKWSNTCVGLTPSSTPSCLHHESQLSASLTSLLPLPPRLPGPAPTGPLPVIGPLHGMQF